MRLKLYYHPLASFCWKALIALYENDTRFEPILVDLGDPSSRAAFEAVWPIGKMPALRDEARGQTIGEATVVVEYLDAFYPGAIRFLPADADQAWQARMWDRFVDHYIHQPMQKIVTDRLRPPGQSDAAGVELAHAQLSQAYAILEARTPAGPWAMGEAFTLVDCSAAPALFYANTVHPFGRASPKLAAYLGRLMQRPSFARVLREAEPFFPLFPMPNKPQLVPANLSPAGGSADA